MSDLAILSYLATFMFIFVVSVVLVLLLFRPDTVTAQRPSELTSEMNRLKNRVEDVEALKRRADINVDVVPAESPQIYIMPPPPPPQQQR